MVKYCAPPCPTVCRKRQMSTSFTQTWHQRSQPKTTTEQLLLSTLNIGSSARPRKRWESTLTPCIAKKLRIAHWRKIPRVTSDKFREYYYYSPSKAPLALTLSNSLIHSYRHPFSKACVQNYQTVIQPCIWFMEKPSQFSLGQIAQSLTCSLHHGETTYRVGWLSETAAGML